MLPAKLSPVRVFKWFGEICAVPHGSGNTAAISDLCESFARDLGLRYRRDELGNIVIFKDASPDRIGSEPVILQGHLDMVCNKTIECTKDMTTEGIDVLTDGERVWADGTSLGADDGIAVAYILAILENDTIPHPPIEAVLTVDEEIGLIGASELDCSILKGRRGINLDSEDEGIITVSCAGGVRVNCELPITFETADNRAFAKLTVSGLHGGHSGIDIDKNRQNAIILLARLLERLDRAFGIRICSIKSGAAMNIIPQSAEAIISCSPECTDQLMSETADFLAFVKGEYRAEEPDLTITAEHCEAVEHHTDKPSAKKLIFTLLNAPNGITAMNPEIDGMVKSSLNLGIAETDCEKLTLSFCVRSNDGFGKQTIVDRLRTYFEYLGGKISIESDYPAWSYQPDSPMRDAAIGAYKKLFGEEPKILAIHAGLECGILSSKLDNADLISFGPDIVNAHTPNEWLGVASAQRCWKFLLELLDSLSR